MTTSKILLILLAISSLLQSVWFTILVLPILPRTWHYVLEATFQSHHLSIRLIAVCLGMITALIAIAIVLMALFNQEEAPAKDIRQDYS